MISQRLHLLLVGWPSIWWFMGLPPINHKGCKGLSMQAESHLKFVDEHQSLAPQVPSSCQ